METSADAIFLENVCLTYGKGQKSIKALENINLKIAKGKITGLMGPDAAGKSTLLRILATLLVPDSGKITIFGLTPQELRAKKPNSIGYMPQKFGLYEDLSVRNNLELYAELRGVANQDAIFDKLLAFTNLSPFIDRLAGKLSGGMKQKLGIACSLLGEPELLLLDEPGVGVDPRSRKELWQMVKELSGNGMTVLWATSYLDEATICPDLIVLEKGKILFGGTPQEFSSRAKGKVFLIRKGTDGKEKRNLLMEWSACPGIQDVQIQGEFIRLEVGGEKQAAAEREIMNSGGSPTVAEVGDAYIAAVGGIDKRPSPFWKLNTPDRVNAGEDIVIADHLTKKFGNFTAARDISFKVAAGEIVGLLGPNGAGKSTTFRMLCGLSRPTSGKCSVDGIDLLKSGSQARNHLGYMAQKFSLYQDITVWENIYISGTLYGLSYSRIKSFGGIMAEALDLTPYLKKLTSSLPLGLKQRLSLLCATLHEPPVLFLDEPTSGVDVRTRRDFWKHISALTMAGSAVLVTTHFMEEAEYCDKIALIYKGNMIKYGSPVELRAAVKNKSNPTMEDAFINFIENYDKEHPD